MERSTYLLTYKGSIPSAIAESRLQKKLFVVYISGGDESSVKMEESTWVDPSVAEAMSRSCILVHLTEGSVDASQFCAIYPQNSVPSISAIGLNGVMLWHHDGYINAESLKENIEKAWGALHLQETAVTLLSAALTSKAPENSNSGCPGMLPSEQEGASSGTELPSTSYVKSTEEPETTSIIIPKQPLEDRVSESDDMNDMRVGEEAPLQLASVDNAKITREDESNSRGNTFKDIPQAEPRNVDSSQISNSSNSSASYLEKQITESAEKNTVHSSGSSQVGGQEKEDTNQSLKNKELNDLSNAAKSNEVYLNIRIPGGNNLQMKFLLTDTLRSVKKFVDENQNSQLGPYDLAVPYPRKLFSESDMESTLAQLGFVNREGLIVVPRRRDSRPARGQSSLNDGRRTDNTTNLSENSGGYFDFVRRVLSYVNPFSYLRGSSDSVPTPAEGSRQYGHNPDSQTHSSSFQPSYQNPVDQNVQDLRRRAPKPFGSNIHTLRSEDNDGPSGDRNVFWNGNSTQFGGDEKK